MANIRQMFPPKLIKGEHLPMRPVTVRIEKVDYELGTNKETKQQEPWWRLYFVGWPLPIMLNKTNTETIAAVLGTPETDDWRGRDITIRRFSCFDDKGNRMTRIVVDEIVPAEAPMLAPPPETMQIITGGISRPQQVSQDIIARGSYQAAGPAQAPAPRKIPPDQLMGMGVAAVTKYTEAMKRRGLTWDAMLKAMRNERPDLFDVAFGVDYADWPIACFSWMNGWISGYAIQEPAETKKPDPDPDPNETLTEDDIPF